MKRFDESIKIGRQTIKLDPRNVIAYNELAFAFFQKGEYDKAIEMYNKSLEMEPDFPHTLWSFMLYYTEIGQYDNAIHYWEKMREIHDNQIHEISAYLIGDAGQLMGLAGKKEEAISLLKELNRRAIEEGYNHSIPQAYIYIGLDDKEKALDLLEQGYVNRDLGMPFLNIQWEFDPLRSDDRFQAIMEKMNFPETSN